MHKKNCNFQFSVYNITVKFNIERRIWMKYKIENCRYELVKDLLSSLDSLIANVEKDEQGTIVTLHEGNSQFDLMRALKQDPLQMFCENCKVYAV